MKFAVGALHNLKKNLTKLITFAMSSGKGGC